MKPNNEYITIKGNNEELIEKLLLDLVLMPRLKALEWSKITKQTPNMKIGYPGQHLASLALGMEGVRTGARGHDIIDGSEVKSCSRVDQVDKCNDCGEKVLRTEELCSNCNSDNIKRMDDSKWLFTLRNENDLKVLLDDVDRIVLTIADYPNFKNDNFDDIRFQIFEIWTKSARCVHFRTLMKNYYDNIYSKHKTKNSAKTPAPCNFWPFMFQFYMCNPIKVLVCIVKNANTENPIIDIVHYIRPDADRTGVVSELMPSSLLNPDEIQMYISGLAPNDVKHLLKEYKTFEDFTALFTGKNITGKKLAEVLPFIDEKIRKKIPLRDLHNIKEQQQYQRS